MKRSDDSRDPASTRCGPRRRRLVLGAASALPLVALAGTARAHGEAHGAPAAGTPVRKEQMAWGIAGDVKNARRRIEVGMGDDMRFRPALIEVRLGETVRFTVRNTGKVMHEFVIGTPEENAKHAELMKRFPTMEHDEPYMAHVAPGKTGEIVWLFNRAGTFEFACLLPGHYEAGMRGTLRVTAPAKG